MNKKITWISSYPKSGNTWIRAIIFCALRGYLDLNQIGDLIPNFSIFPNNLESKNFSSPLDIRYRWSQAQKILVSKNENNIILKTHNAAGKYDFGFFPQEEFTLNAIYVVRDPRDVAVSYSKHFKTSIRDAARRINSETHSIKPDNPKEGNKGAEFTSSWKSHVNGWKNSIFPILILKYEDLLEHPAENIARILHFMKISPKIKVDDIMKFTDFNHLSRKEKDGGFSEASPHTNFFRNGSKSQWKKIPSKSFRAIEINNGKLMAEFGYPVTFKQKS